MQNEPNISGIVLVDGIELCWQLLRGSKWCTADGYKGAAISVRLVKGTCRELLLEYPFSGLGRKRPRISPQAIEADVRRAIAAGWNPLSRGKTFAFQISENSK